MTNIRKSVQAYEDWMGKQLGREMVAKDIALKHEKMRESPFVFLRATYWRAEVTGLIHEEPEHQMLWTPRAEAASRLHRAADLNAILSFLP